MIGSLFIFFLGVLFSEGKFIFAIVLAAKIPHIDLHHGIGFDFLQMFNLIFSHPVIANHLHQPVMPDYPLFYLF